MTLEALIKELGSHPEITVTITAGKDKKIPSPHEITFEEWALRWAATYKAGKVKDNTYFDSVERQLRLHLIPRFGKRPLADILPVEVHEYFCELENKYTVETQHKIKVCLHELYDAAIENRLCSMNPVTRTLKLRSNVHGVEKRTWTFEQFQTAWSFASIHPKGLTIMVLMETAMTRSELLGLEFADFDPRAGTLRVRNGLVPAKSRISGKVECLHEGLKNTYRAREIPISDVLAARIAAIPREIYVDESTGKGVSQRLIEPTFLFYSPQGKAWNPSNWYHRCFTPFMDDLNMEHPEVPILSPHELRHTRASLLNEQGVDLYDIQKLLGHKDLTMLSRRYLHTNVEQLRKGLNLDSDNSIGHEAAE